MKVQEKRRRIKDSLFLKKKKMERGGS